jgi:hypothetical protein
VKAAAGRNAWEGGEGREEGGVLPGAERGMLRETWTASGGGSPRETWRARGWKRHHAAVNGAGRAVVQARGRLVRRRRLAGDQESQVAGVEGAEGVEEAVSAFVEEAEEGGRWVHLDPRARHVDEGSGLGRAGLAPPTIERLAAQRGTHWLWVALHTLQGRRTAARPHVGGEDTAARLGPTQARSRVRLQTTPGARRPWTSLDCTQAGVRTTRMSSRSAAAACPT